MSSISSSPHRTGTGAGPAAKPLFPNLAALLGNPLALALVRVVGGLESLSTSNDAILRQVGLKQLVAAKDVEGLPVALQATNQSLALAKQARLGFLMFAPVVQDTFSLHQEDALTSVDATLLTKGVGVLSRKVLLAARTDQGEGDKEGLCGQKLLDDVRTQLMRIKKSKEDISEDKALPAPEFFEKKDQDDSGHARRRGGKKVQQIQLAIAKRKGFVVSESEAAKLAIANEVRFSTEEEQQERLNGRDMRALEYLETQKREEKRKRQREEEAHDLAQHRAGATINGNFEFDDLFSAQL